MHKPIFVPAKTNEAGVIEKTPEVVEAFKNLPPFKDLVLAITPRGAVASLMEIPPIEKVLKDLNYMEQLCAVQPDVTEPNQLIDVLDNLTAFMHLCATIEAATEYYRLAFESIQYDLLLQNPEAMRLSQSERSRYLKARNAEMEALHRRAERVSRAMVHRADALRSILSYQKQVDVLNAHVNKP